MTGASLLGGVPCGIVVGLAAEARVAAGWGLPVEIGGGTAAGAAQAADRLALRVGAIVSFGLAGGLDPALTPGTLVIPTRVVDGKESWATDPQLNKALGGDTGHILIGGAPVLATADAKARARASTGAHAVDLESAAVARAAARHGLPFAVLRAICDPARSNLPHAALAALDPAGRIGPWRVLAAMLGHPAELPALITLARDATRARRALVTRVAGTAALNAIP